MIEPSNHEIQLSDEIKKMNLCNFIHLFNSISMQKINTYCYEPVNNWTVDVMMMLMLQCV